MVNFFSYFITCSNVSSITDVIGKNISQLAQMSHFLCNIVGTNVPFPFNIFFSCSAYQPYSQCGWSQQCGDRSQLRRHQLVSYFLNQIFETFHYYFKDRNPVAFILAQRQPPNFPQNTLLLSQNFFFLN